MQRHNLIAMVLTILALGAWISTKDNLHIFTTDPFRAYAQIAAVLGATFFFSQYLLSSRLSFIEKLFGSLDRAYRAHRLFGMLTAFFISLHVTFLVWRVFPDKELMKLYLFPSPEFTYTAGIVTFYILVLTILTTVYLTLPYHLWKLVHRATSIMIVTASIHILNIASDVSEMNALRIFFMILMGTAAYAWIYRVFLYKFIGYPYKYNVTRIEKGDMITTIHLQPQTKPLPFLPGQFAFVKFPTLKRQILPEAHPFSIIPGEREGDIRFSIKNLGDYTKSYLPLVTVGDTAILSRAHGIFGHTIGTSDKTPIFIAAGIGITPILSILKGQSSILSKKKPVLIHIRRGDIDDDFQKDIEQAKAAINTLTVREIKTQVQGRVSFHKLVTSFGSADTPLEFYVCGPTSFMQDVHDFVRRNRAYKRSIHLEDFDYKAL